MDRQQQESRFTTSTRTTVRHVQQGVQRVQGATQMMPVGLPAGASPPVFEQIFQNARFAQGGDALFEGKVQGNPKPNVTWTRKGAQIVSGNKYQVTHDETTGVVTLLISAIGPGDEGEYTCTAANQYGEAICTVYIQPEAAYMMQQQRQQQQMSQKSVMQTQHMSQQQFSQQQQHMMSVQSGHMESFRVDTFEYRLLHEVEFRQSLTVRFAGELEVEQGAIQGPPQAPQLQQKPRSTKVADGENATFTVKVNGYPTPRVIWFKNGTRLQSSEKHLMTQSAGQVTLVVKEVSSMDNGYYTMLAENTSGCTVASAQLAVVPRGEITNGVPAPEIIRSGKEPMEGMDLDTGDDGGKNLEPKFVRGPSDKEVQEGKMVRFDARCTGRPYPDVAWFINGQMVADDATHKVLVNEAGNHSLMISKTSLADAGIVTVIAKNKSGEATFQCNLSVLEMQQMVAPKFVDRFQQAAVSEGETVVLQCRAVGTPMPVLSWQKDGVSVENSPNMLVQSDLNGASSLQILSAGANEAGWYQCNAHNSAGSTATRARLHVQTDKSGVPAAPQRPHFPKPVKFIEPEPEPEPEVIILRPVERAHHAPRAPEEEQPTEPPMFTHPLRDIDIVEGTRAHFEAKVAPVGDATMNVDWLIDGKPLAASSRATVTYRFGFVALDILNVIKADAGVYTCRATNVKGQAETSANLRITERPLIESQTHHPQAMQQINYLEDQSRYQRTISIEEHTTIKPNFVKSLTNLGEVIEGKYAHFEAQLHPVSDPFMRIEWFKDGKPITASSRINHIYNFGYVALNIMQLRSEDSGTYTVRATNKAGECTCQGSITVISMSSVTGDLGIPEQSQYIKSVEEMEAYRLQMLQRTSAEIAEACTTPVFKTELKDSTAREGGYAHFEARLEPVGDPTLKIEWLKDGQPLEASSRITSFFNFGYVALTVKALILRDAGSYVCRAFNAKGEAQVVCQLTVLSKTDMEVETQYEDTVSKMQYLEDSSRFQKTETEETSTVTIPPKFLGPLKGTNKIVEGQKAHFEIRLEPQSDPTMTVEWFFNGQVIMSASRIKTYNDFGYVSLDISDVRQADAGQYTVVARNALGQAQMTTIMTIETRSAVDTSSMHEVSLSKTSAMERRHQEPRYDIEEISKSKPEFTQLLQDPKPLPEGKNIHLEARLEPMNDPTMRVDWFFNGKPITIGSRFKTYFDFGFVALDVIGAYTNDSGEYTCRAENTLGSAHTSACVHVLATEGIFSESMNDAAMDQIHYLEDSSRSQRTVQESTEIKEAPSFVKSLKNIETVEGTNIHLEARLKPVGDSSMRIDWFFNDQPLKVGHRFRPAYDFDYVALDLLSVYPVDSGIYTCRATNGLGQAVASASVKVTAKKDLVFDSEHPDSLQKLQYLDDSSRYQKRETMEEVSIKIKPHFLTTIKDVIQKEGGSSHFEAKIEPITDPNLRIEWYRNGMPIQLGSRFRLIHDFGYVALDISKLIEEDSGVYTCIATNLMGKDEQTANLKVIKSSTIIMETENQNLTMEQLQMLEDRSRYGRTENVEESTKQAPVFTNSLKNLEILEGQRAHFEVRLIPTSDPTMKVEWFHNNVPLKSGSRFTQYNDFGFVALDIMYSYAEDSGTYSCVATNCLGQAISTCTLTCHTKESILSETMNQEAMTKISRLESSAHSQRTITTEETTMQAPVFTSPLKDRNLIENAPLHFEARLIPVGDPDLKVEWFKNNVPIQQANRISSMHDFGYVALDMKYVNPEDSGTYTCRATNRLGQAVTSAALVVSTKESLLMESQHTEALDKLRHLEDSSRFTKSSTEETVITQAPRFVVQLSGLKELWEGQSAHVECRLEPYPDPSMKVEWFHNGESLQIGHRFRTMYDFGFCAMDILQAVSEDSGTYEVRATNKLGTATSSITIQVKPKSDFIIDTQHPEAMAKITRLEQKAPARGADEALVIEKPNFGRALRNQDHLMEGQAIHMEATLTPVNDPTMKVEWFFNGQPIPTGHRFRTTYDFGFVALDVLYAYPEDCGTYMCKATNAAGQAVTSCSIRVEGTKGLQSETLDEERMRKIAQLEAMGQRSEEAKEIVFQRPVFTTPLTSVDNIVEGERCHLECRLEPINDPNLRVDWYVNGVEIKAGHRFRTTHDFGYVALDILYSYAEDSGNYLCKATNKMGEAVNSCSVQVSARRSIYMDSQHPMGWEKIQNLEQRGRYERLEVTDAPQVAPHFTSELRGVTQMGEGQRAHLEGRIEPVHDPTLKVEWYHNGKALQSAARFHTTFDFGYVALDITTVYAEDSGEYTCRAVNHKGEATSKFSFKVEGKEGIIYESAHPEGLEKIRQLEDAAKYGRQVSDDSRTFQRPVFTQPLQNLDNLAEAETAHFECRLIPVGDPNLKVEWFRNEKPIETSSRINRTHDFGYVALDITGVRTDDEGIYMCRAYNDLGEAVTTASIKIKSNANIQLDSQHPEGMRKIQAMEERKVVGREVEGDKTYEKPVFTSTLAGPSQILEGQSAHYECRVVPVGDPNMRYEWYCNGVELKMGSRFKTASDFGYVTLDILQAVSEDSGVYMCKAINLAGEAVSSCTTRVVAKDSILGDALHPGWETIKLRETQWNRVPQTPTSPEALEPPMFTKHLESHDRLQEAGNVRLEAQVQPAHDPNLSIEWFKNGVQLATGTRIRSTFDFGHVTLEISGLRENDSGIYTCKATNRVGEAVSTCTMKVFDRDWLIGDSVHPGALSKIAQLEQPTTGTETTTEPTFDVPMFISHLNNVECREGDTAHFECKVEPSRDPTMKIEWFINSKPMQAASRYAATYDFGFVSLDCTHCYAEDSGIYMCRATNSKGSASTTGTLKCLSKTNLYFDTQHPQGRAGLEKVEEAERAYWAKYQRQMSEKEVSFPKPFFVRPLQTNFSINENQALHMEANVEPKQDPDLKIEWFLNGKILEQASRYKTSYDFGLVILDLNDAYERDQGIYTCRAYNKAGEAYCTSTVVVGSKDVLIEDTQHPAGEAGLEAIQRMENKLRRDDRELADEEGHPPVFTVPFKDLSNIEEGEIAHFEAMLTPLGDQSMKVEWLFNGEPLKASHRVRTVYAFGMVVLEIIGSKISDSGEYTCRASNKWGNAECSAKFECVDRAHGQPPHFTTQIKSLEGLKDGDSAHFECTLIPIGDPNMKVEWFHNGEPLRNATRIKTVSDFGFVVLDIAYLQNHDAGEWMCKASNKYGEDTTKATLNCFGMGGVYTDSLQPGSLDKIAALEGHKAGLKAVTSPSAAEPPKFITQIVNIERLVEGQSAHFEARLKPVNDPNLVVEWYKDGTKLPTGHRYRTFHDFGIVILDILYCYEEDSGVYEARAVNKLGEDKTTATLKCLSKTNLILTPQVPKDMAGGLQKLQTLEDSVWMRRDSTASERSGMAPKFTVPLSNIDSMKEGENAHFEARLVPTDDPRLKVEWYWNGKPMKYSSRIRQFCDFGFVIMEISPIYPEDSGEYMCRAYNDYGEAVTKAYLKCEGKRSIILESQLPKSMQKGMERIAELEGLMIKSPDMSTPTDSGQPPQFITSPKDVQILENQLAHFECRLLPVGDPNLRVEWYHNGRPLSAGSRIKTINDFGYVILEMANCYGRDGGTYTCRAINKHGEASVECKMSVASKSSIISDPQAAHKYKDCTESIQKLEESMYKKEVISTEEEKPAPPRFVTNMEDINDLAEGQPAHFDCRVEPVGDSSMRIEWFHNGMPLAAGSRVHMMDDFGFVVLDLEWTFARDSGEYICRATNKWGMATTKAVMNVRAKHGVDLTTQLPQGMTAEKLKALERGPLTDSYFDLDPVLFPPKFTVPIESTIMEEGESAYFECEVEPRADPNLRIEWYKDGKPVQTGHRFRTMFEMGHVRLELLHTYAEDSGEYTCRAVNKLGQDLTRATLKSKASQNVIIQSQVPKGMKTGQDFASQMEETLKKYCKEVMLTAEDIYDADKRQPPRFVTHIKDVKDLKEMETTKFDCQLAPVGDPNMKVEWFFNGRPLPYKNRLTPIYDFGYVALTMNWVFGEDSGEYLCRATNKWGMDETKAILKAQGRPGVIYDSQIPKGMQSLDKIRELEASWQQAPETAEEEVKQRVKPDVLKKPESLIVQEGDWARFSIRVAGHPKPRVMWMVNGSAATSGARFKIWYDGMFHLDIPKTRQYDNGKVEVICKNSLGEAYASCELEVKPRQDDYRAVLKNSPKPWYDYDVMMGYQRDRQGTELDKAFGEKIDSDYSLIHESNFGEYMARPVEKAEDTEWQKLAKGKKAGEKIKELEDVQRVKGRHKEGHMFASPIEHASKKALAKGMASRYEESLETRDARDDSTMYREAEPSESTVHGKEIHTATQKQTQKEIQGDLEITRKITATETTEMEHKGKTTERVVQGQPQKPAKPPFFTKKIQPCRSFEREGARFDVEFDGDPNPTVQWYREDFPITSSPDFQIHTFGDRSILMIREVFMEDSGVFACVAENRGGRAKCSANLVVEERKQSRSGAIPPSFTTTIQDTQGKPGNLVRLDSKIHGTQPIDTYWLKNGRKLAQDTHYKMVREEDTYTLLIIEAVPEDSASYECVAINKAGEARCQANVEIVGARPAKTPQTPTTPTGTAQPPEILQKLNSLSVQEGQGAVFECIISGMPRPKIQWYKGKQLIKQSRYFTMTSEEDHYALKISQAFPEDEGTYHCIATNQTGKVTLEGKLKVIQPHHAEVPPTVAPLEPVTISEGEGVRFNTVVTGSPLPTVQWYREGALIPHSRDFEMFMEGNSAVLDVKVTYPEDTGTFTCRATNTAGQAEMSAMLTVQTRSKDKPRGEPPKFVVPLQPLQVKHGAKVVLEATVRGQPTPRVLWYHLDKEVAPSPEFIQEYDEKTGRVTLTISEIFIDDKGLYRCVAINEYGRDETASYITVEDIEMLEKCELRQAPRITLPLQAQVVKTGSSIDLLARYEAFPPPTIKWYHKGKELKPSRDFIIEHTDDETSLHVEELFEDDCGEYEVRVFNEVGEARTVASVIVIEPQEDIIEMEPPKFIKPLHPQIVPEGEVAILEAEVTAKPEAVFQWYRHGQEITHDEELEVQITSENNKSTLVLGELFEDDSGDYTVAAENPVGRAASTATLLVEGEGAEEAEPPVFNPPLTPIRVMDGEEVRFSCKVTGKPMPKLSWFQNGRPIGHHREVRLTQTPEGKAGLQILEVFPEDEGDYTCIARNKAGEARSTANLTVESYEYVADSEQATVTSVSEKNVFSGSPSEEDETLEIEKDSESDSEAGSSPYFCNRLEEKIEVIEGTSVRLITKANGYPRPTIKWYVDGTPAEVTEAMTVENYEDGSAILTLHKTTLDDCGVYTCEAMNRNGIDTTVTTLVVLEEHTETTSKSYRKPEWVSRMEELKDQMAGIQFTPKFTQELKNSRVKEMETITFTASFTGNPKPDISWYQNSKLIRQQSSYQMRIRNDKAMLTLVQVTPGMKGEYSCRAANSEGEVFSKATLEVVGLTYEEKMNIDDERYAAIHIQHAAEHMKEKERERAMKERQVHQEAMAKMKEDKENRTVQRQQELEDAKKNVWKPQHVFEDKKKKEEKVYTSPKDRRVGEIYANWNAPVALEESYPALQPSEFAPNQIPGVKCFVKVSETSMKGEEVVREVAPQFFEDEKIIHELAKVHTMLKNNVKVNEIWSMFRAGEFMALQQPNIQSALIKVCEYIGHQRNVSIVLAQETQQQALKHPVGLKAFLRMIKHGKNVKPETLFKETIPKEMGKFSSTTQELTKVSELIRQGIKHEEIIASCEAGKLPTLKKAETQQPLVNIVEKHGHSVMVAQVLVEEAYRDAKDDRTLAEKAWEVVHEESFETADVRQVTTEQKSTPAPTEVKPTPALAEQKTVPMSVQQKPTPESAPKTTPASAEIKSVTAPEVPKAPESKQKKVPEEPKQIPAKTKLAEPTPTLPEESKTVPAPKESKVVPTPKEPRPAPTPQESKPIPTPEESKTVPSKPKPTQAPEEFKTSPTPSEPKVIPVPEKQKDYPEKPKPKTSKPKSAPVPEPKSVTEQPKTTPSEPKSTPITEPKSVPIPEEPKPSPTELKHMPAPSEPTPKKSKATPKPAEPKQTPAPAEIIPTPMPEETKPTRVPVETKPTPKPAETKPTPKPAEDQLKTTPKTEQGYPEAAPAAPKPAQKPSQKPVQKPALKPVKQQVTQEVTQQITQQQQQQQQQQSFTQVTQETTQQIVQPFQQKKITGETLVQETFVEQPKGRPTVQTTLTTTEQQSTVQQGEEVTWIQQPQAPFQEAVTAEHSQYMQQVSVQQPQVMQQEKIMQQPHMTQVTEMQRTQSVQEKAKISATSEVLQKTTIIQQPTLAQQEIVTMQEPEITQEVTTAMLKKKAQIGQQPGGLQQTAMLKQPVVMQKERVTMQHPETTEEVTTTVITEKAQVQKEPGVMQTTTISKQPMVVRKEMMSMQHPEMVQEMTTSVTTGQAQFVQDSRVLQTTTISQQPMVVRKERVTVQQPETTTEVTSITTTGQAQVIEEAGVFQKTTISKKPMVMKKETVTVQQPNTTQELTTITTREQAQVVEQPGLLQKTTISKKPMVMKKERVTLQQPETTGEVTTEIATEQAQFIEETGVLQKTTISKQPMVLKKEKMMEQQPEATKEGIAPITREQALVSQEPDVLQKTITGKKPMVVKKERVTEQGHETTTEVTSKIAREQAQVIQEPNVFEKTTISQQPLVMKKGKEAVAMQQPEMTGQVTTTRVTETAQVIQQPQFMQKTTITQQPTTVTTHEEVTKFEPTFETWEQQQLQPMQDQHVVVHETELMQPTQKHVMAVQHQQQTVTKQAVMQQQQFQQQTQVVQKGATVVQQGEYQQQTQVVQRGATVVQQGEQFIQQEQKTQQVQQKQMAQQVQQTQQQVTVQKQQTVQQKTQPKPQQQLQQQEVLTQQTIQQEKPKSKPHTPLKLLKEQPQQETVPEQLAETLQLAPAPTPSSAEVQVEEDKPKYTAEKKQVISEMCVPGFKALVNLATEGQIDLETVELNPTEKVKFEKDIGKLSFLLKKGVQVNELMSMMKEGEFVALKKTEDQAKILDVVCRLESATVHKVLVQEVSERTDRNIGLKTIIRTLETGEESMDQVIMDVSSEFGPTSEPVKEIAAVGHLLQEGVTCDEVLALSEAGLLPSLKAPEAQMPLVSMVADKGHVTTVCEVLVDESTKEMADKKPKMKAVRLTEVKDLLKKAKAETVNVKTFSPEMVPGVKAYVRMAQEEKVSIEEVLQKTTMEPKLKEEVAKIGMMVKHGVLAQDVLTLMETGEFPELMKMEAQAQLMDVVEEFGFKALVNEVMTEQVERAVQKTDKNIGVKTFMRMMQQANVNVEELITEKFPKEMDASVKEPIAKEMARVSIMLKEGVQAEEIMTMIETGQLPNLQKPESQMPLINVVKDQGHSALICQVLVEDSVKDIIQELPKVDSATFTSHESFQSASSMQVEVRVILGSDNEPT